MYKKTWKDVPSYEIMQDDSAGGVYMHITHCMQHYRKI